MSAFNRFCAKAREVAAKVTDKAEELVDSASKSLKIKSLEMRIDEQYEKLGCLVYRDLHVDEDLEEEKLQVIAAIDALFDELAVLKGEEVEGDFEEQDSTATASDCAEPQTPDAE